MDEFATVLQRDSDASDQLVGGSKVLSFEIAESGTAIQIFVDQDGLAILQEALDNLKSSGHVHLRSRDSGGKELNDTNPWGKPTIGEVVISTGGDDPVAV